MKIRNLPRKKIKGQSRAYININKRHLCNETYEVPQNSRDGKINIENPGFTLNNTGCEGYLRTCHFRFIANPNHL